MTLTPEADRKPRKNRHHGETGNAAPRELILALEQMLSNERGFAEFRDELANLLYSDFDHVASVREVLAEYLERGLIPEHLYRVIETDIQRIVTEELATELDPDLQRGEVDLPTGPAEVAPEGDASHLSMRREDLAEARRPLAAPSEGGPGSGDRYGKGDGRTAVAVGTVLCGRFELVERISGGSMGVVFKARDRRLAEAGHLSPFVAVKLVTAELAANGHALRALQQEASKGLELSHPNIVRFLGLDRDGGNFFIVMEWLEGESLASLLDRNGHRPFSEERAWKIVRGLAEALEYAHAQGFVHADIKPGNVMLLPGDRVKLLDFGVARARGRAAQTVGFDPGVLKAATPAYSSPEVLRGKPPEAADDVYSLACLAYRLLAGRRVYGNMNALEAQAAGRRPKRVRGLSRRRWRALLAALSRDRADRPQTPLGFLRALGFATPQPQGAAAVAWTVAAGTAVVAVAAAVIFGLPPGLEAPRFGPERSAASDPGPEAGPRSATATAPGSAAAPGGAPDAEANSPPPERGAAASVSQADSAAIDAAPAASVAAARGTIVRDETPGGTSLSAAGAGVPRSADSRTDAGDAAVRAEGSATAPGTGLVSGVEPPQVLTLALAADGIGRNEAAVSLREDGAPLRLVLTRTRGLDRPLPLRLVYRPLDTALPAWGARSFRVLPGDDPVLAAGAAELALTFEPVPDERVESDRGYAITVLDAEAPSRSYATVALTVLDDDRRALAAQLPPDAVGFTEPMLRVSEADGAIRVTVRRFNPGEAPLAVDYAVVSETALEGQDYFAPASRRIEFEPGAETATLYLPLVRDGMPEPAETLALLLVDAPAGGEGLRTRLAIEIRDEAGAGIVDPMAESMADETAP